MAKLSARGATVLARAVKAVPAAQGGAIEKHLALRSDGAVLGRTVFISAEGRREDNSGWKVVNPKYGVDVDKFRARMQQMGYTLV